MNALRDVLQESGGNLLIRGILRKVDRDKKLLGLGIDITDIDTTFMGEKNPVALMQSSAISVSSVLCVYVRMGGGVDVSV